MDSFFKKGFRIAGLLHALFFAVLFFTLILNHFSNRVIPQHVFQLEEIVVNTPAKAVASKPAISPSPVATVSVPKTPSAPQSHTVASIDPKPAVIPKVDQPKKVSYNDFLKNQATSKPKESKTLATQPIPIPKIQVPELRKNLEQKLASIEISGEESNNSIVAGYHDYVRSIIDASWEQPQDFSGYGNGALFEFDIDRSGYISRVHIIKSSGSSIFDDSIQKAFERVRSVRPTPDGKTLVGCRLTFTKKSKVL